jgi:hypothetical protein
MHAHKPRERRSKMTKQTTRMQLKTDGEWNAYRNALHGLPTKGTLTKREREAKALGNADRAHYKKQGYPGF